MKVLETKGLHERTYNFRTWYRGIFCNLKFHLYRIIRQTNSQLWTSGFILKRRGGTGWTGWRSCIFLSHTLRLYWHTVSNVTHRRCHALRLPAMCLLLPLFWAMVAGEWTQEAAKLTCALATDAWLHAITWYFHRPLNVLINHFWHPVQVCICV